MKESFYTWFSVKPWLEIIMSASCFLASSSKFPSPVIRREKKSGSLKKKVISYKIYFPKLRGKVQRLSNWRDFSAICNGLLLSCKSPSHNAWGLACRDVMKLHCLNENLKNKLGQRTLPAMDDLWWCLSVASVGWFIMRTPNLCVPGCHVSL